MMFIILSLNIEHLQVKIGIKEHPFLGIRERTAERVQRYHDPRVLSWASSFLHGATEQAF